MYRQHGSPPWLVWDSIIRHSHYDFDVDSFVLRPAEEPVSIVAQSGPRSGMDVATWARFFISGRTIRPDPGPLGSSGYLLIGGTPFFPGGPDAPDWYFSGDIFALLIYNRELTLAERQQQASDYLRNN